MPLMTKILKPEEFNSTVLAKLYWDAIKDQPSAPTYTPGGPWEELFDWYRQELIDVSQDVLDQLRSMGVIG